MTGALGLVRLPDVFARMHGAGIIDTLGAALVIAGLMLQAGPTQATAKLVLIAVFLLVTAPTATHALAQAARTGGETPWIDEVDDGGDA